jgi:ribonucleoside-diphosphate reductase alpha chain
MSPQREAPGRHRLPDERQSVTHRFAIRDGDDRIKGYVTVGFYDDGDVGEIFVKIDQQGSTVSGFADAWAIAVSMLLQTGVPLAQIIAKFKGTRFEPSGFTETEGIRTTTSVIDYVCRYLERRFVPEGA